MLTIYGHHRQDACRAAMERGDVQADPGTLRAEKIVRFKLDREARHAVVP